MKYLYDLGLVNMDKVDVNGQQICPLDVIGVTAPNPKDIGKEMVGRTCGGLWVTGKKDGLHREIYMYQYSDNQQCLDLFDSQAVVAQTAATPAIVAELICSGKLEGPFGARVPEELNPDPVMKLLADYHFPAGVLEMESEYREAIERRKFLEPLGR
jgi:saccharopine dehydrogenase-like NADP-dependent oxidoreductase